MPMLVMQVRVVRMRMHEPVVSMGMTVRLARRVARPVRVPVMGIVTMPMRVLDRFVDMLVLVALSKVKP